ncbi:hypothetical protein [Sphingomonas mucosissima]|uniref:Nuclear transport factor 2 family protein n=1 Tax=Sphingomonas mucosissima TaxID=370959 RepID=A0A245ZMJ4_9SPHN|nr:hypothetical protein [Sphingomonas mucosissima]OWK30968.1 hypothetical protein SPMU_19600 [Sphingomonas mucosissima]
MAVIKMGNMALLLALAACSAEPGVANAATAAEAEPAQGSTAPTAAKPANEQFVTYWQRFRKAALAGDIAAIAAASAPRVKTHGALDSDPSEEVAAAAVPPLVKQALADDAAIEAGGRTLRQVMESATAPKREANDPLGYRRVGAFVFEQVKGRWFLTEIYAE